MNTRRKVLKVVGGAILCSFSPSLMGLAQEIPAPPLPSPSEPLRAGAAGCGAFPTKYVPRPIETSGVDYIDKNTPKEINILNMCFRVQPTFSFQDDTGQSPQAFALRHGRGTRIFMGIQLIQNEVNANNAYWESAIMGILAHEWAHAFQYWTELDSQINIWETHADYMAGWYLGSKLASGVNQINIRAFADSLYLKGDRSGYFNPDKYGSPERRVGAMVKGFLLGKASFRANTKPNVWDAANRGFEYVANSRG